MKTTWNIAQLKRKPENGLVFNVTYIINFEHESESDRHVGTLELEGDPESPNFTPYESLTKEIVEQWIKDALGEERIQELEGAALKSIQKRIDKKNNPEFLTGTPWGLQ